MNARRLALSGGTGTNRWMGTGSAVMELIGNLFDGALEVGALQIIANELDLTMAFCGLRDIRDVDSDILWR